MEAYKTSMALASIVIIFWFVSYALGHIVLAYNVKVNYTRKIGHFSMFVLPNFFYVIFNIQSGAERILISVASSAILFLSISQLFRNRIAIFNTMFISIDRPEDRPNTLWWLFSQTATGLLILGIYYYFWQQIGIPYELLYLTILATTIGDGLAEPIGVRFGRRKYTTKGFFVTKEYHRTIEGSATVFLVSLICCFIFGRYFTFQQFLVLVAVFPLGVTLTEAKSPHTWDTPFIFLIGNFIVSMSCLI